MEMFEFWLGPMRRFMSWVGFAAEVCVSLVGCDAEVYEFGLLSMPRCVYLVAFDTNIYEFGWFRCGGV